MEVTSKFRNGSNARLTKALFQEFAGEDKSRILYTLKPEDTNYPSIYRLYIFEDDLTEYTFANKYFENWEHWEMVAQSPWFKPFIARWRKELRLKLESLAMTHIVAEMKDGSSKNKYSAAKTVLDQINKQKPQRGRPSKEEVQGELIRQTHAERTLQDDLKRVMNNGGVDT